nr:STM4014 family protein [Eubacterium sp.]
MDIKLIGKTGTKRTDYFLKAAEGLHIPVTFVDWDEVEESVVSSSMIKIDPPAFQTSNLYEMNGKIETYRQMIARLSDAGCSFLNAPEGITKVLDKRTCKQILQENGVPVTWMFPEKIHTVQALMEAMERHRTYSVFIKPILCSGAAGVTAFRMVPGSGRMTAYTSCVLQDNELVNTKRLRKLEKPEEVRRLLEAVLSLNCVVERWQPKASFQGKSFDLRVVYQFGKIAFMVARQSSGPITNLHLNNAPLSWEKLGLSEKVMREIESVCRQAMEHFPELRMAGIDVLLEKDTLRPYVIEVNGQGDLMYQDIFNENRIYREQLEWMAAWEE